MYGRLEKIHSLYFLKPSKLNKFARFSEWKRRVWLIPTNQPVYTQSYLPISTVCGPWGSYIANSLEYDQTVREQTWLCGTFSMVRLKRTHRLKLDRLTLRPQAHLIHSTSAAESCSGQCCYVLFDINSHETAEFPPIYYIMNLPVSAIIKAGRDITRGTWWSCIVAMRWVLMATICEKKSGH